MTGTVCDTLRDRMPDIALGRAEWSDDEARHLESCAECVTEWRLVSLTATMGAAVADRVDPARIAEAVLEDRRAGTPVVSIRRRAAWAAGVVAVAAALLLVFGGLLGPAPESPTTADAGWLGPELDDLETTELILVLDQLETTSMDVLYQPGASSVDELETGELEDVLQAWEG
jgi:hypothetical protein